MQVAIQKPLRKDIVQKKVMKMISDLNLQPGDRLLSEKKTCRQIWGQSSNSACRLY